MRVDMRWPWLAAAVLWLAASTTGSAAPAPAGRIAPPQPDLVVVANRLRPYVLSGAAYCRPGTIALTLVVYISNIGATDSPAVADPSAISVQDAVLPDWTGGVALPSIPHGAPATVMHIGLYPYHTGIQMIGHHDFKISVNSKPWFGESSFANNSTTIGVDIPNGFCGYSTLPSPAVLNPVNPPQPPAIVQSLNDCTQALGVLVGGLSCPALLAQLSKQSGSVGLAWGAWVPCSAPSCVQQIDGYTIYKVTTQVTGSGGRLGVHLLTQSQTKIGQANAQARLSVVTASSGDCFALTAYAGGKESDLSSAACVPATYSVAPQRMELRPSLHLYTWTLQPGAQNCTTATVGPSNLLVHPGQDLIGIARAQDIPTDDCDLHYSTNGYFARSAEYFDVSSLRGKSIVGSQLVVSVVMAWGAAVPRHPPCGVAYVVGVASQDWTRGWDVGTPVPLNGIGSQFANLGPPLYTGLAQFDVTNIVKGWLKGDPNYGFAYQDRYEDTSGLKPGDWCLNFINGKLEVQYY